GSDHAGVRRTPSFSSEGARRARRGPGHRVTSDDQPLRARRRHCRCRDHQRTGARRGPREGDQHSACRTARHRAGDRRREDRRGFDGRGRVDGARAVHVVESAVARGARRVRCVLRNRLCDGGARAGCPHFGRAGIDSRLPGPIDRTHLAEADRSGTVRSGVTATPRSITTRPPCSVCILLSSGRLGRDKEFQTRRRGGRLPLMSTLFSGTDVDRGSGYPALRSRLNESRLTVRGFVTPDPTISIVTPAYNASEFVAETITSALGQTWRDFELLIVDDGSTDDTLSIARAWE